MKNFFINKFEYNHYSNQQLILGIENTPSAYSKKAQTLIGHTFNAQNIWNHRLLGKEPTLEVWEVFEIVQLQGLNNENHQLSLHILEVMDLTSTVNYKSSKGDSFSNSVENILFHIINHSTYHRGQLMTELKLNGMTTISTDFIFYKNN